MDNKKAKISRDKCKGEGFLSGQAQIFGLCRFVLSKLKKRVFVPTFSDEGQK